MKEHPEIGIEIGKKNSARAQNISREKWVEYVKSNYDRNFSSQYKNSIRKRDNQVCMNCSIHREKLKKALDIHHINYDKKLTIPENCISLCNKCHALTNFNREYWTNLFQEKLTRLYGYKYDLKNNIIINFMN